MSLLDRIRQLWKTPEPDHPLSEEERREVYPRQRSTRRRR
jgi:hypothetical protein